MKTLIASLFILLSLGTANAADNRAELIKTLGETLKEGVSKPIGSKFIEVHYEFITNSENECLLAFLRNSVESDPWDDEILNVRSDMFRFDFSTMSENSFSYKALPSDADRAAKALVAMIPGDRKPIQVEVYDTTQVYRNGNFYDFSSWKFLGVTQAPYLGMGFYNQQSALDFMNAATAFAKECNQ